MAKKPVCITKIKVDGVLIDAKKCSVCEVIKPLYDFNKDKSNRTGFTSSCRDCRIEHQRLYRRANNIQEKHRVKTLCDGEKIIAKECSQCKELKSLNDFPNDKNRIGGKHWMCFKCRNKTEKRTNPVEIVELEINGETCEGRECSLCKTIKPLEQFPKHKGRKRDVHSRCKDCISEYNKITRVDEAIYTKPLTVVCSRCGEEKEILEFEKNRTRPKGVHSHCKRCLSYTKAKYRNNNIDKIKEYFKTNKERLDKIRKKWRKTNIVRVRMYFQRYRTMKNNLPSYLTNQEYEYILTKLNNVCAISDSNDTHLDHFIPLSWGHGGTYLGNLYLLDKSLNISKGNENPFEWIKKHPEIDALKWEALIDWLAFLNGLSVEDFMSFVYWCEDNKRSVDDVKKYPITDSLYLWKSSQE